MQSPAAHEGFPGSTEGDSNFTTQTKGYEVTGNEWLVNNGSSHFLTMFEVREAPVNFETVWNEYFRPIQQISQTCTTNTICVYII